MRILFPGTPLCKMCPSRLHKPLGLFRSKVLDCISAGAGLQGPILRAIWASFFSSDLLRPAGSRLSLDHSQNLVWPFVLTGTLPPSVCLGPQLVPSFWSTTVTPQFFTPLPLSLSLQQVSVTFQGAKCSPSVSNFLRRNFLPDNL